MLAAVPAEAADVKELFTIDLADYPGKEGRMIQVSYPPGARDMVHRHDAHAFVYVLEGQIVMQLKGQPAVTLKAGQTFSEGPTDVHVVGRNASNTVRRNAAEGQGRSRPHAGERMMLGTVRPTRHRSVARVLRGWLMRGVRHERDGWQLDDRRSFHSSLRRWAMAAKREPSRMTIAAKRARTGATSAA
jgi:quercetin dioxygenase-like cupin family protein